MPSTPNGFDPRWIDAINTVMEEREVNVRITDISTDIWDRYIGPMCDEIEKLYRKAGPSWSDWYARHPDYTGDHDHSMDG